MSKLRSKKADSWKLVKDLVRAAKKEDNAPRAVIQMHPERIGASRGDGRGEALSFSFYIQLYRYVCRHKLLAAPLLVFPLERDYRAIFLRSLCIHSSGSILCSRSSFRGITATARGLFFASTPTRALLRPLIRAWIFIFPLYFALLIFSQSRSQSPILHAIPVLICQSKTSNEFILRPQCAIISSGFGLSSEYH